MALSVEEYVPNDSLVQPGTLKNIAKRIHFGHAAPGRVPG